MLGLLTVTYVATTASRLAVTPSFGVAQAAGLYGWTARLVPSFGVGPHQFLPQQLAALRAWSPTPAPSVIKDR